MQGMSNGLSGSPTNPGNGPARPSSALERLRPVRDLPWAGSMMLPRFRRWPCLFLVPLAAHLAWSAPLKPAQDGSTERAPLLMSVGEQHLLRIPGLTRYSLGGDFARAHAAPGDPEGILIKGVRPGTGDLYTWSPLPERRSVEIRPPTPESAAVLPLLRALSSLQEVEVLRAGQLVTLSGTVRSLGESARIAALDAGFPGWIHDQTLPSPELLDLAEGRLRSFLAEARRPTLRVERIARSLWVRGSVEDARELPELARQLRSRYGGVRLDIESLPDSAPTIHFQVFLLELKRSRYGAFGLSWPEQAEAFHVTSWAIRDVGELDLMVRALEGEGSARVLSNPELVVRAPGEAELFAGGELPIRSRSHYSSNVQWKPYGLTLRLNVRSVAGDRVRLDILTEVSHLDGTGTGDEPPGIQANRMKTQVDARFGAPLFLSGLLQQGMREQARGLPWLRRIPVLGSLFGSQDYLNERSELVAILLPGSAPPPAPRIERPASLLLPLPEPERQPAPQAASRSARRPVRLFPQPRFASREGAGLR
jgi:hypothetical protein